MSFFQHLTCSAVWSDIITQKLKADNSMRHILTNEMFSMFQSQPK